MEDTHTVWICNSALAVKYSYLKDILSRQSITPAFIEIIFPHRRIKSCKHRGWIL